MYLKPGFSLSAGYWLKNQLLLPTKKVVSDSPELVDFAVGLVNSVLNLADGQVNFFGGNSNYRRTVINPAHEIFFEAS